MASSQGEYYEDASAKTDPEEKLITSTIDVEETMLLTQHEAALINDRETVRVVLTAIENYKGKLKAALERAEIEVVNIMKHR